MAQFPRVNRQGAQGYYYMYPYGIIGRFIQADGTVDDAKKMWNPVISALESYPNIKKAIRHYKEYPTFKEWFDVMFNPIEELKAGEALQLEPPTPRGNLPMDSWLLGAATMEHPKLSEALRDAMPKMQVGMLRGHLTAGGKVNDRRNGAPYVNPAWRTAMVHLIGTGVGLPNITSIKRLERNSGSYSNEDLGSRERDWKRVMWGRNYNALLEIKHQVDPKGLFWATPGIGADEFLIINGRLCNIVGVPDAPRGANFRVFAPEHDNKNMGSGSKEYKPFPTQEECDKQIVPCVP
jgi:Berberine and berberine like